MRRAIIGLIVPLPGIGPCVAWTIGLVVCRHHWYTVFRERGFLAVLYGMTH